MFECILTPCVRRYQYELGDEPPNFDFSKYITKHILHSNEIFKHWRHSSLCNAKKK